MDPATLRRLLIEGIQAAKANNRPQARESLLRVLEADDQNEPAWLWLSAVLDDPADQLMALERVLAINPAHPEAQAGAQALRQRLGKIPSMAPPEPTSSQVIGPDPPITSTADAPAADAEQAEAATASPDLFLSEDDPFQCAYCGQPTRPEDERCRYCQRSLLVPGNWHGGGYLYFELIVTGLQLQAALIQALAGYLTAIYPQVTRILPFTGLWNSPLWLPALLRAVAWAVVVSLLLADYEGGYGLAALVAVIDMAWAGVGYRLGLVPQVPVEVNTGLAVIIFLIGVMAVISQAQSRQRLRVVPDRGVEGALLFHQRALGYARQGKWALAALHWRRAISRAPAEPVYYKALGRANIRLGRYVEAVRAFRSGAEAAPSDREFTRLIEMVRAQARTS